MFLDTHTKMKWWWCKVHGKNTVILHAKFSEKAGFVNVPPPR